MRIEKHEDKMDRSLGRIVTEGIAEITQELAAANKAIVALSEALDDMHAYAFHSYVGTPTYDKVTHALTAHAPAIEKARGG